MMVNREKKIISNCDKMNHQDIAPEKRIKGSYHTENTQEMQVGHLILQKSLETRVHELVDDGWKIINIGGFTTGPGDKPTDRIYCLHCKTQR